MGGAREQVRLQQTRVKDKISFGLDGDVFQLLLHKCADGCLNTGGSRYDSSENRPFSNEKSAMILQCSRALDTHVLSKSHDISQ
mmetsp:Transcript_33467/g.70367  ORF Transcript_33467/g.70367 Transcript_33467/m.70367 type:complete len:84 (-) Transcript_33467:7-258(-)